MKVVKPSPERVYEDLRQAILQGATCGAFGLAVFLRQGMAAWLGAIEAYCPVGLPVNPNPQPMSERLAGSVVRLLVEMVLSPHHEVLT